MPQKAAEFKVFEKTSHGAKSWYVYYRDSNGKRLSGPSFSWGKSQAFVISIFAYFPVNLEMKCPISSYLSLIWTSEALISTALVVLCYKYPSEVLLCFGQLFCFL